MSHCQALGSRIRELPPAAPETNHSSVLGCQEHPPGAELIPGCPREQGVRSLKNTHFKPRYVLLVPKDKEKYKEHLRRTGLFSRVEIEEALSRVDVYLQINHGFPGYFHVLINTDDLDEAFTELTHLVKVYLGLEPPEILDNIEGIRNRAGSRSPLFPEERSGRGTPARIRSPSLGEFLDPFPKTYPRDLLDVLSAPPGSAYFTVFLNRGAVWVGRGLKDHWQRYLLEFLFTFPKKRKKPLSEDVSPQHVRCFISTGTWIPNLGAPTSSSRNQSQLCPRMPGTSSRSRTRPWLPQRAASGNLGISGDTFLSHLMQLSPKVCGPSFPFLGGSSQDKAEPSSRSQEELEEEWTHRERLK
ncbi:uncharacterized protein LOC111923216 [Cyanistes caeruleus]|uniref:uncharacterized protein LOC111923216 n=1 Tax=Cyanistes caeruleus TaxID=156563 RepID=UPI000CDAC2E7|nr:uncharacterized protein LOC111923216 [Cyanistes caeruleus]